LQANRKAGAKKEDGRVEKGRAEKTALKTKSGQEILPASLLRPAN